MTRVGVHRDDSDHVAQLGPMFSNMGGATSSRVGSTRNSGGFWKLPRFPSFFVCSRALRMQIAVVRNATGSVAAAWAASACYSLGNALSGKRLRDQSLGELIIANSVWASVTFCTVVFLYFLPLLISLRFLDLPDQPPTVWRCLKRLMRATLSSFITAAITVVTFGYAAAYMSSTHPDRLEYKVECYADNFLLLGYFTGISRAVKKLYYEETCQGHARLIAKQEKSRKSVLAPSRKKHSKIIPYTTASPTLPQYRTISFWRAYMINAHLATPALLVTAFVHLLSRQRIVDRGTDAVTGFVIGSIAFKLGVQEFAKCYILRKRVRSTRIMCVLVGLPTVLIDTQARIILLGISSTGTAVIGTLLMALIETCLRVGKARFVRWSIVQREGILLLETASPTPQRLRNSLPKDEIKAIKRRRQSLLAVNTEFEMWRRQVQAFHTAELDADMYAEYIAIGCSAAIIFFYSSHPHFSLLREEEVVSEQISVAAWRLNQLVMLVFQMGVEIVVDYTSIVLEMMAGIEFDHIENLGSFLAALFMVTSVMNVTISIGVYLS